MRNFSRGLVQFGVLIFATILLAMPAQASLFSAASLKGSYGFMAVLWTANPSTPALGMVGVMTFDGAGNVTAAYSLMSKGTINTGTWAGTYTVNSNGIGAINFTTGSAPQFAITVNSAIPLNLTAPAVAHGFQLLLTNDTNNEVVSGTAVLQSAARTEPNPPPTVSYGVANLRGSFASLGNTLAAKAHQPENGNVAIFTFDGQGNFMFSGVDMFAGALSTGSWSGTYTVEPNGVGSIYIPQCGGCRGGVLVLNSVVAGQAGGFQIVNRDTSHAVPNGLASGTAVRQYF